MSQGWSDIGYHYIIELDGRIVYGRLENKIGAHCKGHNAHSIGICYVGGLETDGKTPKDTRTRAQKKSLLVIVKELMEKYKLTINDIHCHNEYANKACPSFNVNDFRKELNNGCKKDL